ncbi:MAG: NPCBM/NEW2 domain-containing protein [Kiritimatiellia bacterium]
MSFTKGLPTMTATCLKRYLIDSSPLRSAAFALLAGAALNGFTADALSIGNSRIRVSLQRDGHLTLAEPGAGQPFATVSWPLEDEARPVVAPFRDARLGTGQRLTVTRADGRQDAVFVLAEQPFAFFQSTLKNSGASLAVTNRVPYPALALNLGVPAADLTTLGSGGLLKPDKNPGSYMWSAVADPATRRGVVAGWISTDRGSGIVRMERGGGGVRLLPHLDYGRLPLAPGQEEPLELFVAGVFGDARLGLEAYADLIAARYAIRLPPMPTVHCTWYVDGASRESVLSNRTDFAAKALKPFGLGVMQIDDGWQLGHSTNGPKKVFIGHNPDGPYPSGMKAMADTIRRAGFTPGLWLIPFAGSSDDPWFADKRDWFAKKPDGRPFDTRWGGTCFDLTRPDTQAYLKEVIRTLTHAWGYRYLKMDGLYTGASINLNYICDTFREDEIGQAVLADPAVTQIEMMRNSLNLVRTTAGPEVFLLGCCTPQNMRSAGAAYGLVHAMRIGPDNGANWSSLLRGPEFGAWNYFLHGRVWYNDPDPLYARPSLPLEQARAICSWVALSGQMNSSSEEYANLPPERLDLLKRTMPSITADTNIVSRPVDLFENRVPGIWLAAGRATDRLPRRRVAGLFNWENTAKRIDVSLAALDLADAGACIAFDLWSNALTPPFQGRLSHTLRPQSCAVLAVRPVLDRPQLIATSRHITQGLIDVTAERWEAATRTLSGVSETVAGDRYELRILTYTGDTDTPGRPARGYAVESAGITGANGYELTVAPGDGLAARPDDAYANANTPDAPITTLHEPAVEEGLVRVAFTSGSGGPVAWRVTFSDRPAPPLLPAVRELKAAMPDRFGPVVLTWRGNTRACEIRRDGKVIAAAATGGLWHDAAVSSAQTYRYELVPYTLSGARGEPQSVAFTTPVIPRLGEPPPRPEVPLDALTPLAVKVGWGAYKRGTALNGPLRLGAATYASGICIHADGHAVFTRDPSWKRFVAVVGIDESQRPQQQSSLLFSVAVEAADGRRVLDVSPVIRFGQRERWHFDVALPPDAERVVLLTESAGDGIKSDHGNWCDAGFIR